MSSPTVDDALVALSQWYGQHARTLPWRSDPHPWRVLVSEVMLQQTPVLRVLPVYEEWIQRWPEPRSLASASPGEAVRLWGRLGYPRRALRLHAAATACVQRFNGAVPHRVEELRSLPGVGEYTAAAVSSFAFGQRQAVLDTNVRRVHARWLDASEHSRTPNVTAAERARALALLPLDGADAAGLSVAMMELGALVCTARTPRCDECPIRDRCAWRAAGFPRSSRPPRRGQPYAGTDRQCRGRLLAVLRDADGPVTASDLDAAWKEVTQRTRALDSLLADGLVARDPTGRYMLP